MGYVFIFFGVCVCLFLDQGSYILSRISGKRVEFKVNNRPGQSVSHVWVFSHTVMQMLNHRDPDSRNAGSAPLLNNSQPLAGIVTLLYVKLHHTTFRLIILLIQPCVLFLNHAP